ncbi:MAG: Glucose--fructose oxidoreductase precursor [candidate division BRC1 bacterium ADurb.BinA364]|nr:MAG: Glucose--fructose oxidoreductase precursor [candidate division BRC1 bacterium ADurb.BinA364]
MSSALGVAVIGCGYWGPNLVRNFNAAAGGAARLVCDRDRSRLAHMRSLYPGLDAAEDAQAAFDRADIDAVAIATPAGTHFVLAERALRAGKHVFVEKPLATRAAECERLIELAREHRRILMVGHTFLYCEPVRMIRDAIARGDLGDLLTINSRRLSLGLIQNDINAAWDLAPHDISIILNLLGESPSTVNCQGQSALAGGVEDVVNLSLKFNSGLFATIQASWIHPNKVRELTVVGSRRMLVYDDVEPLEKIRIYDKRVESPAHHDTFADFQYAYHYGDTYCPYIKLVEPLAVECRHFLECIRENKTPLSDGENGLAVVRVLEAANESLRRDGAAVRL